MIERPKQGDRAILVSLNFIGKNHHDNTEELIQLVTSAGFQVAELIQSNRSKPDSKYFMGSGKAKELIQIKTVTGADTLIFNH